MPRNHLKRFADLKNLPNVFQGLESAKTFNPDLFFGNSNPVTLELACGKGEYTVELARRFPNRNFIGIERKGNRLWIGAKSALDLGLKNVAFLRMDAEMIGDVFNDNTISEIWITFPDPYPKPRQAKRRLTSSKYLHLYKKVLKDGGLIHLKTDDNILFESTLKAIRQEGMIIINRHENIYLETPDDEILYIKTQYENRFLASDSTIKYLCFGCAH